MSTTMRAKFVVASVERFNGSEKLKFNAVGRSSAYPADGSDEDNTYARFTPLAQCELHVNNPDLQGKFNPGDKFYVDFTPTA